MWPWTVLGPWLDDLGMGRLPATVRLLGMRRLPGMYLLLSWLTPAYSRIRGRPLFGRRSCSNRFLWRLWAQSASACGPFPWSTVSTRSAWRSSARKRRRPARSCPSGFARERWAVRIALGPPPTLSKSLLLRIKDRPLPAKRTGLLVGHNAVPPEMPPANAAFLELDLGTCKFGRCDFGGGNCNGHHILGHRVSSRHPWTSPRSG